MKPGKARFKKQITKIEKLFAHANTHENPALWLFLHDLRTPAFMLEGLSKLYSSFHNAKSFVKLKEQFKELEDALGSVDYYAAFQKEFHYNKAIPVQINQYFQQKTLDETKKLNKLLIKKNWLNGKKIKSISDKLDKINWRDEKVEKVFLENFYKNETIKIAQFVNEAGFPFDNLEDELHELRRKLRWLSIYPQALAGAIKLEETVKLPEYINKYLTNEIVNSSFNVLPVNLKLTSVMRLEKNKFLALSWLIAEIGRQKDLGMKINSLKNAFQATSLLKDEAAYIEAYKYLGKDFPTLNEILENTSEITRQFFAEQNLNFVLP
jgi:hypothetical protein